MSDPSPPRDEGVVVALVDALAAERRAELEDPLADLRLEGLADGTEPGDASWLAELATASDVELDTLATGFAPLGDGFLDGLADQLVPAETSVTADIAETADSLASTTTPEPANSSNNVVPLRSVKKAPASVVESANPSTGRRWALFGGVVAAAAAAVLFFALADGPAPIADYSLDRVVGVSAMRNAPSESVRLELGGGFTAVLRPSAAVSGQVSAKAWLKHAQGWVSLPLSTDIADTGAIRVKASVPSEGVAVGSGELFVAVGRQSALPSEEASSADVMALDGATSGPVRLLRRPVQVVVKP